MAGVNSKYIRTDKQPFQRASSVVLVGGGGDGKKADEEEEELVKNRPSASLCTKSAVLRWWTIIPLLFRFQLQFGGAAVGWWVVNV